MPFLISQNKKLLLTALTVTLLVFSTVMLVFDENADDTPLSTKASVINSRDGIRGE